MSKRWLAVFRRSNKTGPKMNQSLDVGMRCIKFMLFVSNFMFVLIGFLLISIGSTIGTIYKNFENFIEAHYINPALIMVVVGIFMFLICLFGCVGAIQESTMLVNLYGVFLSLILIVEMSIAIVAYTMRSNICTTIEKNMIESMDEYNKNDGSTESWDFLQSQLQCCGVHVIQDWSSQNLTNVQVTIGNQTIGLPQTCCVFSNCEAVYNRGCLDRLSYIISECAFILGTGAVCVAIAQILGVVFANMLAKAIRRAKTNEEMIHQQDRRKIYDQLTVKIEEKKKICGSALHHPKLNHKFL